MTEHRPLWLVIGERPLYWLLMVLALLAFSVWYVVAWITARICGAIGGEHNGA